MTDFERLNVLVLAGGISHERDVSLRSGRRVSVGLAAHGHRVTQREPDGSLFETIREIDPDVVWPALHGASGENGALRALLTAARVPFVGSDAEASRLAWLKPVAKTVVSRVGVSTPVSITIPTETFRELGAASVLSGLGDSLTAPLVVKPAEGGSAQGVTYVDNMDDLPRALVNAYTYNPVALIERRILGVEVAVTVLDTGAGPTALPAVEIVPREGVYSFEARYNAGETSFFTPARLSDDVSVRVAEAAVAAHEALGLSQISRVDMIVDAEGEPWFLEANVLPGLTETSLVPLAIDAAGFDLGAVYSGLAEQAIRDATERDA